MKINAFEGARRIALLIGGLWGIGVVLFAWNQTITVSPTYVVTTVGVPPSRSASEECASDDASEWRSLKTPKGTSVSLRICFRAHKFSNGEMLVPYRADTKTNLIWGDRRYSSEVTAYTSRVSNAFYFSQADSEWIDSQWWPELKKHIGETSKWLFGGWVVLWLITATIGWVVRGFCGIPLGADRRPETTNTEPSTDDEP